MFATYHIQFHYLDIRKFSVVKNAHATSTTLTNRQLINQIKSCQLPVVRAIFERVNPENVKEYYIFDFTGRRFVIKDTLNREFSSENLVNWIAEFERKSKVTHGDFVRMYAMKKSRTFRDVVTEKESYFLNFLYHFIDTQHPDLFINFKRSW